MTPKQSHIAGLELALQQWNNGGPSAHFAALLRGLIEQAQQANHSEHGLNMVAAVSEAKAQGVVMPDERSAFEKWGETLFFSACFERHGSDEYAGRGLQGAWLGWQARAALSAAPIQQLSVPDGWEASLNLALVLETERAIKQRDEFLKTGISTAALGGSHDTCFAAIVRRHIAMLAAAPAVDAWIPVSDRLPSDACEPVWCHGTYEDQHAPCGFEGIYRHGRWVCLNNGDYIDGGYGSDYEAQVTHWMPLPAPPAARAQEGDE